MGEAVAPKGVDVAVLDPGDAERVLEVHSLLASSFPPGLVEDEESFLQSVSRTVETGALPTVVCALRLGAAVGAVVGAYLPRVNVGMVLYSAVERRVRSRGLYGAMRARLVEAIAADARVAGSPGVDYIVSEVEQDSPLHRLYASEWRAYTAPCDYWQPETQGLSARPLKLVLQPVLAGGPPTSSEVAGLVREIYRSVYRLAAPEEDPSYRRVILSLEGGSEYSVQPFP